MDIKDWLKRAYNMNKHITYLLQQQAEAFSVACGSAICTSNDSIQTSGNNAEDKLIRYLDFKFRIDKAIDEYVDVRREIASGISKLECEKQRRVLIERHLLFKNWGRIQEELGITQRHVFRIYSTAKNNLIKYIENA